MIFFYVIYYIGSKSPFLHCFFDRNIPFLSIFSYRFDKPCRLCYTDTNTQRRHPMNRTEKNDSSATQRHQLFTLCRFLATRISYRFMLLLLSCSGLFLTASGRTQFAPYGIALVTLLLPSFLSDSVQQSKEKENSDIPLSALYKRYHYSPVLYTSYRIALTLCMLLLFVWHKVQTTPFTLFGISVPLLCLALALVLSPVLSRILFLLFHRRLMSGTL